MTDCTPFTIDSVPITSPYCTGPLMPPRGESESEFVCTVCNVKCCGRVPFNQHLQGASHRRQLQLKGGAPLTCTLCELSFTSSEHLEGHLNGQKHKRKLQLSSVTNLPNGPAMASFTPSVPPVSSDTTVPLALRCSACDLICSSSEQLTAHLSGKKHAKKCKLQANFWVAALQANKTDQTQSTGMSPAKASKRRTFFRLPKNLPETSPEVLLQMENALPLTHTAGRLSDLPFCVLPSRSRTTEEEPDGKRPRSDPESVHPSDIEPEPVTTRFCGHLNCVIGRAAKLYQLTLQNELGPSYVPPSLCESKTESTACS